MKLLITGGSGFIGTNLVDHYLQKGVELINLDWNPPLRSSHADHWKRSDLMDREGMIAEFKTFDPTHVVHLAARTDTDEQSDMRQYIQNTEGTQNVLDAIKACHNVEHAIITSTQFVCEAGYQPKNDTDYKPFTLYGESKKLTEDYTRNAGLKCKWSLIRPTTIWGPWSLRYRDVLFPVVEKGLYFHPSKKNVIRSYGYVGNVVWQIDRIFQVDPEKTDKTVFYVGDQPFDLRLWVDAISDALIGKKVRYVPTFLVHLLAIGGDIFKAVGFRFPITSGRFRSMTQDYVTPMDHTESVLGKAPFSLEDGATEMVRWYKEESAGVQKPSKIVVE